MDPAIMERLLLAELALLDPAVRADRDAVEAMLDPEFTEIGQSGTFWTRDAVVDTLLSNDQSVYAHAELAEPRVTELAEQVYLLTYVVQIGAWRSRRSSIWRFDGDRPRMVFNQGTALPGPS